MAGGDSYDHVFKLLMVGDSGVGKTSILLQFTSDHNDANIDNVKNTVGVDLKVKVINFQSQRIKLTIWDTAGQERFRTLTSAYYRGAHGIVLVYDVTSRQSFENIQEWLKEVDIYSTRDDAVKLLCANKIDMNAERLVTTNEGREFARAHKMLFMECSAKTADGIQQSFEELLTKVLETPGLLDSDSREAKQLHVEYRDQEQQGYCC